MISGTHLRSRVATVSFSLSAGRMWLAPFVVRWLFDRMRVSKEQSACVRILARALAPCTGSELKLSSRYVSLLRDFIAFLVVRMTPGSARPFELRQRDSMVLFLASDASSVFLFSLSIGAPTKEKKVSAFFLPTNLAIDATAFEV